MGSDTVSSLLANPAARDFIRICQLIWDSPAFRLFALIVFVLATIWVIAKVYSGDLQNAEKGPLGIREHTAQKISIDTLMVTHPFIDMKMDGVTAKCTFYYVYDDAQQKRQHVPLLSRQMTLSVVGKTLSRTVGAKLGNECPDVATEDVCFPILDIDTAAPETIEATPPRAQDYMTKNRVLDRWSGDDKPNIVSVHKNLLPTIEEKRIEFIEKQIAKLHAARAGGFLKRLSLKKLAKSRPGAIGNFYVKFQFSNDPFFVLSRHPDRDVRMTAWLTILTSIFAIVMELFPLNLDQQKSAAAGLPPAALTATPEKAILTNKPEER